MEKSGIMWIGNRYWGMMIFFAVVIISWTPVLAWGAYTCESEIKELFLDDVEIEAVHQLQRVLHQADPERCDQVGLSARSIIASRMSVSAMVGLRVLSDKIQ